MKTAELTGAALDWAVAKCEGLVNGDELDIGFILERGFIPSTEWGQCGPIIERESICIMPHASGGWLAKMHGVAARLEEGQTPLIAAMRCYVTSKLGDEVDVPKELL